MEMQLHNFTPNTINILDDDGNIFIEIPSEGIAKVGGTKTSKDLFDIGGAILIHYLIYFTRVDGLPKPSPGHKYIVSEIVAQLEHERSDLLIPDDPIYDEQNNIIGYKAFTSVYIPKF